MNNLIIQIITNKNDIKKTLESVSGLNAEVHVVNYNNYDYGDDQLKYEFDGDYSKLRNQIIKLFNKLNKANWYLSINDDEILDQESIPYILEIINSDNKFLYYKAQIIYENNIINQVRLWHKNTNAYWIGKVNETLIYDKDLTFNHDKIKFIKFEDSLEKHLNNIRILEKELENNENNDLRFKLAIEYHITNQNIKSLKIIEDYFFYNSIENKKYLYLKYLMSWIYAFILYDHNRALQILFNEIKKDCSIPEFWCLLGDIYFNLHYYKLAKNFYNNALISSKYTTDLFINIDKYNKYPLLKIEECEKNNLEMNPSIIHNLIAINPL